MNDGQNLTIKETFNLALKNHQNNNLQDAQNYYQKVLKIDPNHLGAHNNLGVIFKILGENQKAKNCYEKAIEINPNHADAHNNLGLLFQKLGDYQKSKSCYEKVLKIDPNNINSINAISTLLGSCRFDYKSKDDKTSFKKLIISLLNKSDIETSFIFKNAKSILFSDDEQNQLEEAINSDSLLSNKVLQRLLKEELFHLLLQKSTLADIFL